MGDNQHRRIDFVDLTKGVCIILVVMAHIGGAFDQLDKHSMLSCFRIRGEKRCVSKFGRSENI